MRTSSLAALLLLATTRLAAQTADTKPRDWPKLPGKWVLVLPSDNIFVNPDSFHYIAPDTFSVLMRVELLDSVTTVSRHVYACDRPAYRMVWGRRYSKKGKAPTFERYKGYFAEWDPVRASDITATRIHQRICAMARLAAR